MLLGTPSASHTRWDTIDAVYVLTLPSQTWLVFSSTSKPRGATMPKIAWWSNGRRTAVLPNCENVERNQQFSPVICERVCTSVPAASIASDTRQLAEPPEPDSWGIVR